MLQLSCNSSCGGLGLGARRHTSAEKTGEMLATCEPLGPEEARNPDDFVKFFASIARKVDAIVRRRSSQARLAARAQWLERIESH